MRPTKIICQCQDLDDNLIAEGWTCYACYEGDSE